jgi:hypothetical protein
MNILSFKYTKQDGKESLRVLAPLYTPNGNAYFGIDITELEPADQVEFAKGLQKLEDIKMDSIDALMAQYDISHNFRNFLPIRMSNIEAEEI